MYLQRIRTLASIRYYEKAVLCLPFLRRMEPKKYVFSVNPAETTDTPLVVSDSTRTLYNSYTCMNTNFYRKQ